MTRRVVVALLRSCAFGLPLWVVLMLVDEIPRWRLEAVPTLLVAVSVAFAVRMVAGSVQEAEVEADTPLAALSPELRSRPATERALLDYASSQGVAQRRLSAELDEMTRRAASAVGTPVPATNASGNTGEVTLDDVARRLTELERLQLGWTPVRGTGDDRVGS